MIRILIVEDEPPARQLLADLLREQPGVSLVGEAADGVEGLRLVAELQPDAVFLDIEMPGMTGTELMRILPEPRPALVFVTAYREHAVEAFEGGAVHYLLKPISRLKVAQALARLRPASDPLQADWLRIPGRRRGTTRLFRPEEVDALVADLGDCQAWTSEGPWPVDGGLAFWEERLGTAFLRIHRNALVRLAAIRELTDKGEVVLGSGAIAVSTRRLEEVRRVLGLKP